MKPSLESVSIIGLLFSFCISIVLIAEACNKKYEPLYDYDYDYICPTPYGIEIARSKPLI